MDIILGALLIFSMAGSCGGPKGSKSAPPVVPTIPTTATISSISDGAVLPNEDVTISGPCTGDVLVTIATTTMNAVCTAGSFTAIFPANDVPVGSNSVSVATSQGTILDTIDFVKDPCGSLQTLNGGVCENNPIANASFSINGVTDISGTSYVTSSALSLSLGTTSQAKKIHVFESVSDCNDYSSNSCQLNPADPSCLAITHYTQNAVLPVNYSDSGASNGVSRDVVVLYSNETELSSCLSSAVTLDNAPPALSLDLSSVVTHDPQGSVELIFDGGAVSDVGGSGLTTLEVGIGTSSSSANLVSLSAIGNGSLNHTSSGISPNLAPATNYYFIVRATDALGNTVTTSSDPWTYVGCTSFQTLTAGACVDNAIATPQFLITSGSIVGSDRFVNSGTITVSSGTTSQAQKLFILESSSDCSDFQAANCHLSLANPGCSGITVSELTPGASVSYPSSVTHGNSATIAAFYANGTQTSSCLTQTFERDSLGPSVGGILSQAITHQLTTAPRINLTGGAIIDQGDAGVDTIEFGISSNGTTPDLIAYSSLPLNVANITADLTSALISANTNYYYVIRAVDKIGNETVFVSSPFQYQGCNANQTPSGGTCVDKPVLTPQFAITSGQIIGSDRFTNSNNLTLSYGTTTEARKVMIFNDLTDCNAHLAAECVEDAANPGCAAITKSELDITDTTHTASLPHGSQSTIAAYFANGIEVTSCLTANIEMDNLGPAVSGTLSRAVINDPDLAPVLNLGGVVVDQGNAGVSSIEYGVSSNGTAANVVAMTSAPLNATSVAPDISAATIAQATNYYILVKATDALGNVTDYVSSAFTYAPCLPSQNLVTGNCVDKAIATPQFLITSGSVVGSDRFTTSSNLTLSSGTTSDAQKMFVFNSSADCSAHIAANCFENAANPGCAAITSSEKVPGTGISYAASLTHGSQTTIASYYANGTQVSSCLTQVIELDNLAPSVSGTLSRVVINDPDLAPALNFGGVIADQGNSGLATLEVGASSNGTTDNLVSFVTIPNNSTGVTPDISAATIAQATNYYIIIRATDSLGQATTYVSGAFTYVPCTVNQSLVAGNCVDKAIATPQFLITSGSVIGSDRFTTTNNLTVSAGTTSEAQKMFVFNSSADCSAHIAANCFENAANPGCAAITVSEFTPGAGLSYTASLTHGSQTTLAAYYSNNSAISACLTQVIELDNQAPNASGTLARVISNDPDATPVLNITGGAITDNGNSGLLSVEYAVSTDGTNDDVKEFTSFSAGSASLNGDMSSYATASSTNYYIILRAEDNLGQVTTWTSPAFTYVPCGANQTLTAGACVDNAITGAQLLITSATDVSGNLFQDDRDLVLSMGTTSQALRAIVTRSLADCNSHISNGCYTAIPNVACTPIVSEEFTPSLTMNYNYSTLVSGAASTVAIYYVNGSVTSSCVTRNITLDTDAPNPLIALASNETMTASSSPQLNFTNAPVPDVSGSGMATLEVGIGSTNSSPDVMAFTTISSNSSNYTASGLNLSVATDYYFIVRATDNLGNATTVATGAWRFDPCNNTYQTTETNGSCTNIQYACTIANGSGSQQWDGGSGLTACSVDSCNIGYETNGGNTACVIKACSSSNFTLAELSNMGIDIDNTNEDLTNGSYPSCTLASNACDSGYVLAYGNKRCIVKNDDKVIGGFTDSLYLKNGRVYASTGQDMILSDKIMPADATINQTSAYCALTSAGRVYCWGPNSIQSSGITISSTAASALPIEIYMGGVLNGKTIKSLTPGGAGVCAIASDDLAYCWGGTNAAGELGNGNNTLSHLPVAVDRTGVLAGKTIKKIAGGSGFSCVIASDDKVYCWGVGTSGQLGHGASTSSNIPVAVSTAGVLSGKTIVDLAVVTDAVTMCAIDSDGKAYCWGGGTVGNLGNGAASSSSVPVAVTTAGALSGKVVRKITTCSQGTIAITTDNRAYIWGAQASGMQGDGITSGTRNSPGAINITTGVLAGKFIQDAACFTTHSRLITTDGLSFVAGSSIYTFLGGGVAPVNQTTWVQIANAGTVVGKTLVSLHLKPSGFCMRDSNGKFHCAGSNNNNTLGNNRLPTSVLTWSEGIVSTTPIQNSLIADIGSYSNYHAFKGVDNKAYAMGLVNQTILGNGVGTVYVPAPIQLAQGSMPDEFVKQVAIGDMLMCAIGSDDRPYCWGANGSNRTGAAVTTGVSQGLQVSQGEMPTPYVKYIAAGATHACVIGTDDYVYCWGAGVKLGTGGAGSATPVAVNRLGVLAGKTFKKLSAGAQMTCGISTDDKVYCWGAVSDMFGDGSSGTNDYLPKAVDMTGVLNGKSIIDIAVGASSVSVLASDYKVYCWGAQNYGQCGIGVIAGVSELYPVQVDATGVLAGKTIVSIGKSSYSTCALANDGTVACWGWNNTGQLANGLTGGSESYPVSATRFNTIP